LAYFTGSRPESKGPADLALHKDSRRSYLAGSQPISSFDGTSNGGYPYREQAMVSSGASSSRRSKTDFVSTKWAKLFFVSIALQAVLCVAFEA
jgi:hypothetical protein